MTFKELQKLCEHNLGIVKLSDIARELNVTPQVVSNWKSRNQVPYRYIKDLKKIIENTNEKKNFKKEIDNDFHNENMYHNQDDEFFILDLFYNIFQIFKRYNVYFIILPVLFSILSIIWTTFFVSSVYESYALVVPIGQRQKSSISNFSSIASKYGIELGGEGGVDFTSAEFYPVLIKSRRLTKSLLDKKFDTDKFGSDKSLLQILTYKNNEKPDDLYPYYLNGSKMLAQEMITVKAHSESPLFIIKVKAFEAKLAADIINSIIDELKKIQIEFKMSKLNEKKTYIDFRMNEILKDLTKSEDELKEFREKNRIILSSPALMLEQERQIRELEVLNQVYITLRSEWEIANIEVVESRKNLEVLDPPETPLARISPRRTITAIIAYIFGIFATLIFASIKDFVYPNILKMDLKLLYERK